MYSTLKNQILCKGFLSILLILISMSSLAADFTVPLSSLNTQFTIVLGPVSSPYTMWQLEQSYESNAGPWVSLGKKPIGNTSVTVTQFGKYFYRARQYNPAYGTWGSTQPIEIYDSWIVHGPVIVGTSALGTPQLFQSSDGDTSFDGVYSLQWSAPPSGSQAVTYYQWKEGNGSWNNVGTALSSIQITKGNGSYTYSVQACNASSCGASATYAVKVDLNVAPTITPSTLNSTDGKYNIGWTTGKANGKAFTHVWVYENNNPTWVYGATHDGRATINQNPLVLNKTVQGVNKYYVLACHGITFGSTGGVTPMPNTGTCIKSTEKSITVIFGAVPAPNSITSFQSYNQSHDINKSLKVVVGWGRVGGATHYELLRNEKAVFAPDSIYTADRYTDIDVVTGTTLIYKVRACIEKFCSNWISASPLKISPRFPFSLYSTFGKTFTLLDWLHIDGATSYQLERNEIPIYSGSKNNFNDTEIDINATYRLRACVDQACSPWRYDRYKAVNGMYSGINYEDGSVEITNGGAITWGVHHEKNELVKLTFRYAGNNDQKMDLKINNEIQNQLNMPSTESSNNWSYQSAYVSLKEGINYIEIVSLNRITINYLKIEIDKSNTDISQVWNKVATALRANNRAELTKYFDPKVMQNYNQVFDMLGSNIIQVGNQLGSIEPMYISETSAEYILTKKGDDGNNYVHIIKFIKDAQGNWKVNSL